MCRGARWFCSLLVVSTLCWAVPAAAQGSTDRDEADPAEVGQSERVDEPVDPEERMLELNEEGFSAFAEGDFEAAARKFEQAHGFVPDPNLRKNAAIAWFKADDCERASRQAVFFLLADEMTIKDRVEARSVLGHCRLEVAEEALEQGDEDRAAEIADYVAALETDERVNERRQTIDRRLGRAETRPPPTRAHIARTEWAVVGAGVAILAGSALYHVLSARQEDTLDALERTGSHAARQRQLQDNVDTAGWLVPSLYGVGAITTGTGLWLALSADTPETKQPAASPRAGRQAPAASVQIGWTVEF
ncbi:MAG: hypothetical protein ACOC9W_05975 [Persicimonas sp.]